MTVLRRPERAARLPLELIARETAEGEALLAVADAVDHAALPGNNLGLLLEHFRGSPHEALIAPLAAQIEMEAGDEGEQEAVFADAVERLRANDLRGRIDALNARARAGTLSAAERRSLTELLARKSS